MDKQDSNNNILQRTLSWHQCSIHQQQRQSTTQTQTQNVVVFLTSLTELLL
jgi:hypothetical protein